MGKSTKPYAGNVITLVRGQGVHLRAKRLSKGRASLFLDIYKSGKRAKEFLGLHYIVNPTLPEDKETKRENIAEAKVIRSARESEVTHYQLGTVSPRVRKVNLIEYSIKYLISYQGKDRRIVRYSIEKLVAYLLSNDKGSPEAKEGKLKEFNRYVKEQLKEEPSQEVKNPIRHLNPREVDEDFLKGYKAFLDANLNGETPYNYFTKMKALLKQATKDKLFIENPAQGVENKREEGLKKDILFMDEDPEKNEVLKLLPAYCPNKEVRRAFLFSLNTGLRWVDVKTLTWSQVEQEYVIRFQSKTKKQVSVSLNDSAKELLGERGKSKELVFNLPSHTGALKALRVWTKNAGIDKHITWHSSRHSFAVNILGYGTDIKTVSDLLGHSGLKHTEKYTRVVDKRKKEAVNALPSLKL